MECRSRASLSGSWIWKDAKHRPFPDNNEISDLAGTYRTQGVGSISSVGRFLTDLSARNGPTVTRPPGLAGGLHPGLSHPTPAGVSGDVATNSGGRDR